MNKRGWERVSKQVDNEKTARENEKNSVSTRTNTYRNSIGKVD